jgi:hypothetical protein
VKLMMIDDDGVATKRSLLCRELFVWDFGSLTLRVGMSEMEMEIEI